MKFATAVAILAALAEGVIAKDERTFAVLRFNGKALVQTRADPIVSPGQVSSHVHSVMGGSGFSLGSTGKDLMDSNCSNAMVKGDNSNYWFPQLYFQDPDSGKFEDVEVFYVNAYYFFEPTNDEIKAFPIGLSMVTGDAMTRDPPPNAKTNLDPSAGTVTPIKWTCPRSDSNYNPPSWPAGSDGSSAGMGDPINKGEGVGFPDVNCDGYASPLRADMHFPSCYNPKAGLTNFKENSAFPSDAGNGKADCPKGWIHVPHLFIEVYWDTPKFSDRWEQGKGTQPFVLANGDTTGFSSHADFMAGWDEELLQHIIDTCDTGTGGMDNCPGLFYGLNEGECTISPLVDEKTSGVLDKLPGNNAVSGWQYGSGGGNGGNNGGNNGDDSDSSSSNGSEATAPADTTKPIQSTPEKSPTETYASQGDLPQETEVVTQIAGNHAKPTSSCSTKTRTVIQTVTVTGDAAAEATGSSNSTDSVAGFQYAGCFKDSSSRALAGDQLPKLGPMSNEKCVSHCKDAGFSHAGTEYGGECFCGNELVGSEKVNDSQCSMACKGDSADTCGGDWALSVYSQDGDANLRDAKRRRHLHGHIQGSHLRSRNLH